jgi:penicillin-binding protein 1A
MNEPPTSTLPRTSAADWGLGVGDDSRPGSGNGRPPRYPRTRVKKLRLALILLGLAVLALVSTLFGMLMAVASDLPSLENQAEYKKAKNSVLLADNPNGRTVIGRLTGNKNRILLTEGEISPMIKNAVIAIEDRRFYEHEGVDYKGIARALWQDILRQKAVQGGSTITQQFVKNALSAQGNRSVFQKLREAALAYHMERRWSKQKIITQYLNSVYFGNGAYGIESAMRTYFGGGDDQEELEAAGLAEPQPEIGARDATPAEAAMLAGMIASPAAYDPVENPRRATARRNLVLRRMLEQGMIGREEYEDALAVEVPTEEDVHPPSLDSSQPYFSSWLTQQLVDRYRPGLVFGGGLQIKTTLDPELQAAAEEAVAGRLGAIGPSASLVAIENRTGEVKAMVGGTDFDETPFNLATNGHRQPGSAFKPFTLIAALQKGISPDAVYASHEKSFPVPGSKGEYFEVSNYEDQYYGSASLRAATAVSDNSVFAELGLQVGTERIARLAGRMGIRTPISTNPAMTLGGLEQGLTPLEMAYAYSVIANRGRKVSGTLAPNGSGPVAIERVEGAGIEAKNERRTERVFSTQIGETAHQLLAGVVQGGTGKAAQIGEFAAGKTGTTENYGDAWFVGFNKELTVAVWVGYPDKLIPMETEYRGSEVAGGTYPAEIWQELMSSWIEIRERREAESGKQDDDEDEESVPVVPTPSYSVPPAEEAAPTGTPPDTPEPDSAPARPQAPQGPQQQQQPAAPAPAPPPSQPQTPPAAGGGGAAPE